MLIGFTYKDSGFQEKKKVNDLEKQSNRGCTNIYKLSHYHCCAYIYIYSSMLLISKAHWKKGKKQCSLLKAKHSAIYIITVILMLNLLKCSVNIICYS